MKIGVDLGENYYEPRAFVESVILAEKLGFDSVWLADHFMPWTHDRLRSSYVWCVMASAMERTETIKVGTSVTSPIGGRYPPAIIAQASATLDNLHPGRFMLGVGSGEAMNESRFMRWPGWKERTERLCEATTLMRKLWTSEEYFDFDGKYFAMKDVLLYTKPATSIPIYFSALGPKAAFYAGKFGDHLLTMCPPEKCRDLVFPNFLAGAREAGKDLNKIEKLVLVTIAVGDRDAILATAKIRHLAAPLAKGAFDEPDPRVIQERAGTVTAEEIAKEWNICRTWEDAVKVIERYEHFGATYVVVGTGANPDVIRTVGERVLPCFKKLR